MNDLVYELVTSVPSVEGYCSVRASAGMLPKNVDAIRRGLRNTVFGVTVLLEREEVGMGRVIGDGAVFFEIVDVAVKAEHQGRGLGHRIMESLLSFVRRNGMPGSFVSLVADPGARSFYERYGFSVRPPDSPGMSLTL